MSERKPKKRLVSKEQYVRIMGKKLGIRTAVSVEFVLALIAGFLTVGGVFWMLAGAQEWQELGWHDAFYCGLCLTCIFGTLTWATARFYIFLKAKADVVEPVALITDQNVHLLPAQETLLRGSNLPPTIQQAELLRATQVGQETPKEQLLRATIGEE